MNSLILNLLKLFLSYICDLAHPCQFVPIDSAPRASQAKKRQTLLCAAAGDATYAIGFGPCRIFAAVFSVRENSKIERSHGGNDHEERRVFWSSRILDYSWIFLYSHSNAWIMSRRNRICPACTQTVSPCHGKDHYDYENDTKWSFAIYFFCFWYLLKWFVVGCFEGFFSPTRGKSLTKPSHTEDVPYLEAEKTITEASPEELSSCSLAFHKVAVKGLRMTTPFKPQVNHEKQRKGIRAILLPETTSLKWMFGETTIS